MPGAPSAERGNPERGRLLQALKRELFADSGHRTYAVLDGAAIPGLLERLAKHRPRHVCLIPGQREPELAATAPYLVNAVAEEPFTEWLLATGWGNSWGLYVTAARDLEVPRIREHLRALTRVQDEAGKTLFFRFYDPRVLRTFLPTCTPEQLAEVFGPLAELIAEGPAPDALVRYRLAGGQLEAIPRPLEAG